MLLDGGRKKRPFTLAERPDLLGTGYRGLRRYARVAQALIYLVVAARRRTPTELWFGDSHSIYLNQRYTSSVLSKAPGGQLIWHLGPRLMWSLARRPLPRRVRIAARLIRRFGRHGSIVPVFSAGEIDVRCHLVPRSRRPGFSFDFVALYVAQVQKFAVELGASRAVIVAPVPPSDDCPKNPMLPIKGTIEERVAVFEQLRDALVAAVAAADPKGPAVRLIDSTPILADDTGALHPDLTDDGVHTNLNAARLVRLHFGAF